ncbi:MAG: DHHA1 domain-containing protein, partial [Candidatus Cryptobacteroides sp.]
NNTPNLSEAIKKLIDENTGYKKEIEDFLHEKTAQMAEKLGKEAKEVNGVKVVEFSSPADPNIIKNAAAILQKKMENFIFAAAFEFEGKPNLVLMYSPDLVAKGKNAGKDIREAAKCILGGGGGQPGLATAGGKKAEGLKDALAMMTELGTR